MQKRAFERVNTRLDARFFCGNMFYSGIITNLSENGMFISTKRCLPFDSTFEILIHLEDEILKVPVKVTRIVKTEGFYDGMGVELLERPRNYLEFVNQLKSTSKTL
jgi:Tfp pilus assembly protein PilZ